MRVRSARESGKGYWMPDDISGTFRAQGENRPSRPSNVIYAFGIVEGAHGVTTQRELGATCAGVGGKPGQGYAAVLGISDGETRK